MRFSNPKRILITGITGFVGSHIADTLSQLYPDCDIYGVRRWHLSNMRNITHLCDKIKIFDCDLVDPLCTLDLIESIKPEIIFHCAAQSFVSPSWTHPSLYMDANYKATVNILEGIRKYSPDTFIHLPGSGEEYGDIPASQLPITNDTVINPVNPYAVSKVAQDLIGSVYHESYGTNVIRTRAFNHEGPRRQNVFGLPWYAYQIARIKDGLQEPILRTGVTSDKRNFTHVLDMVSAYISAVQHCQPGELYLIGNSDPSYEFTFHECLLKLLDLAELSNDVEITQVSAYTRPTQVPFLIADNTRFKEATGWKPVYTMDQILEDTLQYWMDNHHLNPQFTVTSSVSPIMPTSK